MAKFMIIVLVGSLTLLATPPHPKAETVSPQDPDLSNLRQILEPLRRTAPTTAPFQWAVSPSFGDAKHLLRNWAHKQLSQYRPGDDLTALNDHLNTAIDQAGLTCDDTLPEDRLAGSGPLARPACPMPDQEMQRQGFITYARFSPINDPRFLLLTTGLGLNRCGQDFSAILFRWTGQGWVLFWQAEQNDYRPGHYQPQAVGSVQVSPPAPHEAGASRLVAMGGESSGCASSWVSLSYDLWSVRDDQAQTLLLSDADYGFAGGDPAVIIAALTPNSVQFQLTLGSIDLGVLTYQSWRSYQVVDGRALRGSPNAESPQGFVEEWLRTPWSLAQAWTRSKQNLAPWHAAMAVGTENTLRGEYLERPHQCPNRLWQITYGNFDEDRLPWTEGPWYFLVEQKHSHDFRMHAISHRPFCQ